MTCTQTQTVLSNMYTDPGFSASDNLEGSYPLTAVTVKGFGEKDPLSGLGRIDLTLERSESPWLITYNIADAVGNVATQMTRKIFVIPPCEPLPACPKRKLCKTLSTATEVVCETCSAGAAPICLVQQEAQQVADLRPPVVTSVKKITLVDGSDPYYSYRAQDEETRQDIIVAYVEQGRQFSDPGATALETITSTNQKTGVKTTSVNDVTLEITTRVVGSFDTQTLNPGDFFTFVYEISTTVDSAPSASRTRPVVILNPCATTTTPFGDVVGTKNVDTYDKDGVATDEFLCHDDDHFERYGEKIYTPDGQCSTNGACLGIALAEVSAFPTHHVPPLRLPILVLRPGRLTTRRAHSLGRLP